MSQSTATTSDTVTMNRSQRELGVFLIKDLFKRTEKAEKMMADFNQQAVAKIKTLVDQLQQEENVMRESQFSRNYWKYQYVIRLPTEKEPRRPLTAYLKRERSDGKPVPWGGICPIFFNQKGEPYIDWHASPNRNGSNTDLITGQSEFYQPPPPRPVVKKPVAPAKTDSTFDIGLPAKSLAQPMKHPRRQRSPASWHRATWARAIRRAVRAVADVNDEALTSVAIPFYHFDIESRIFNAEDAKCLCKDFNETSREGYRATAKKDAVVISWAPEEDAGEKEEPTYDPKADRMED